MVRGIWAWPSALLFLFFIAQQATADVQCYRCDAVMHTNQPQTHCWNCQQPLSGGPSPSFPPSSFPPPPHLPPNSSGFELGVTIVPTQWGIRVTGVNPGSPANGVLFVNDTIVAAAYINDFGTKETRQTRTGSDMEMVKHMAGQNETALMIRRPSGQVRYAFVSFQPVLQEQRTASGERVRGAVRGGGSLRIDNSGRAAAMFDQSSQSSGSFNQGNNSSGGSNRTAEDFFNN